MFIIDSLLCREDNGGIGKTPLPPVALLGSGHEDPLGIVQILGNL